MDWKVYVYETDFEQEIFDAFTTLIPSDDENIKFLAEILEVTLQEGPIPPVYTIVDMYLEKYREFSIVKKYLSIYPHIERVKQWLSLVLMDDVSLPITLYEKHLNFNGHLLRLRWKDQPTQEETLFVWSLYLPVIEKLYTMSEFESGEVYSKLPNTISGVTNNKELEVALRNYFIREVENLTSNNSGGCTYRTIHPLELKDWNFVYAAFLL